MREKFFSGVSCSFRVVQIATTFSYTTKSLLQRRGTQDPAVCAHLLWPILKGNRESALFERGGRKEGADGRKSPPPSKGVRVRRPRTKWALSRNIPRENVPFYGRRRYGRRRQERNSRGAWENAGRASERRYVCDFRAGYEQGGFKGQGKDVRPISSIYI